MARKDFQNGPRHCSFCNKHQKEVRKLIAGRSVAGRSEHICDECIRLCTDIIEEEADGQKQATDLDLKKLPTPKEISAHLDKYVIGQSQAKKILSVAVYNHYKRLKEQNNETPVVELQKSNVLLVGPTGTGKTLLAQTLARFLDVPFTIADATCLTEAGYVGEDVENIITNLLVAADHDVERAQRGIVYIDEIDKIARKGDSPTMARDVSGEGVQQALLKIIEGTRANVPPRGAKKYGQSETIAVDTSNILVICGGSFTGIDKIIQRRIGKKGLGFGADIRSNNNQGLGELLKYLEPQDLYKFGLIPEFIGRLPVIATLEELMENDLERILCEPKNALLKQYKRLFHMEKVDLLFDEGAVRAIAQKAIASRSGARGLRAILEELMLDMMYEVPFLKGIQSCEITEAVVQKGLAPHLKFEQKKSA